MLCYLMLCYVMLCYVACHVMLCYVMSCLVDIVILILTVSTNVTKCISFYLENLIFAILLFNSSLLLNFYL